LSEEAERQLMALQQLAVSGFERERSPPTIPQSSNLFVYPPPAINTSVPAGIGSGAHSAHAVSTIPSPSGLLFNGLSMMSPSSAPVSPFSRGPIESSNLHDFSKPAFYNSISAYSNFPSISKMSVDQDQQVMRTNSRSFSEEFSPSADSQILPDIPLINSRDITGNTQSHSALFVDTIGQPTLAPLSAPLITSSFLEPVFFPSEILDPTAAQLQNFSKSETTISQPEMQPASIAQRYMVPGEGNRVGYEPPSSPVSESGAYRPVLDGESH
jgi:hypothetical protein